jgi:hypothetical protein
MGKRYLERGIILSAMVLDTCQIFQYSYVALHSMSEITYASFTKSISLVLRIFS